MWKILAILLWACAALPLAAQELPRGVGLVTIPYIFGDGGIVALQAGAVVPVTWNDPPPDALAYVLVWRPYFEFPFVMGIDINPADGVVHWKVPEHLGGMPYGVAVYADGTRTLSDNRASGLEYGSGTAPPEGICSVGHTGMDGVDIYGGGYVGRSAQWICACFTACGS